jgi:hypothetical protein
MNEYNVCRRMPCPYFIPTERLNDAEFVHPARLPLGAGYRGFCGAPGHEGAAPTDEELKQGCNLGYARSCSWLPKERAADAVRFSILRDRDGQVSLCYVSELNYLPCEQGHLHFEVAGKRWVNAHRDSRVQTLAECFLNSYMERRGERKDSSQQLVSE